MDIFKLGDKILDLLNVIFAFWNKQISLVFELLGQSPTCHVMQQVRAMRITRTCAIRLQKSFVRNFTVLFWMPLIP